MYLFYVYAYLRNDGTPYYIGKGKNRRAYEKHINGLTPKDISRIIFLERNLSNIGSLALERFYIRWYGRKDIGTGILRNRTDGGDGTYGEKHSEETKNKIRLANLGRTHSSETKKKLSEQKSGVSSPLKGRPGKPLTDQTKEKLRVCNLGKLHSDITKEKCRAAVVGRKMSEETKQKISAARRGKPLTEQHKENLSKAFLGKPKPIRSRQPLHE